MVYFKDLNRGRKIETRYPRDQFYYCYYVKNIFHPGICTSNQLPGPIVQSFLHRRTTTFGTTFLIRSKTTIMSLATYKKKRSFDQTPEPTGGTTGKKDLTFVIQKHDASHLHYDFRLEMDGVLKSWAIPKGPSTDPKTKRLAMMVEDHPYDYRKFEGIIPEGQYGGGTVIVWDEGTYEPIEDIKGKKAQEKHLLKGLKSGSLKIKLHGEKLHGEFALVKTHGMGDNAWLLIKHNDDFASTKDITKLDKSVLSGKTIPQMEKTSEKVWQHGHEEDV